MSAVRRADDLAWVDSVGRVVVVRLVDPGADPLVLADSAAAVWRELGEEPTAVDVVAARVAAAYGVAVEVVADDVRTLLDDAARRGIVYVS